MGYTTLHYLVMVLVLLVFYYVFPLRSRYLVLLAGSLYFYLMLSLSHPGLFLFFMITVLAAYGFGRLLESKKKTVLVAGWVLLLLPLLAVRGRDIILRGQWNSWIVPVGISFYTMQLCAYLADIYRGKISPEKNVLKFVLFASWFPQIIQGPIPRYEQLSDQLGEGHPFSEGLFRTGLFHIIWGLFLKFMIADRASPAVAAVFENPELYSFAYVLPAGVLYSLQLYTDFLSCTELSKGVSLLFGIRLADNFDHPYGAESIRSFWRRWHISFSSWLRDYVYIPLGGSRKGKLRGYLNLCLTFLVSGIWHGGGLQYIAWGLYHAFWQIAERLSGKKEKDSAGFFSVLRTDVIVMLGWIMFRANGLKAALKMYRGLFRFSSFELSRMNLDGKDLAVLLVSWLVFLLISRLQTKKDVFRAAADKGIVFRWSLLFAGVLVIWIFGAYGYGFDAANFIYGGF